MESVVNTFPRVMPDFAIREKTFVKPIENFDSAVYRRLFEEDLVDTDDEANKVIAALKVFCRQRGLSMQVANIDELLEEYEDMVFGRMMEDIENEPVESMEDVMEFLRQR